MYNAAPTKTTAYCIGDFANELTTNKGLNNRLILQPLISP